MILGHQKQWNYLTKAVELKRLPHAFLFSGAEQLGKRTLAVEFVKFINCLSDQAGDKKPCQVCRNCQDISKNIFPDFIFIKPSGKKIESKQEIKISQIKNLIEKLSLRPYSSFFKIAVLDNAHLMNKEAQNCFLKFLEEPKGKSILILITEFPDMLLPTILSRVQEVKFFPVKSREIKNYFLEQKISEKKAEEFSSLSFGKPGRALNFYLNPEKLEREKKLISDILKLSQSELSFRFRYVKSFSDLSPDKLKEILDVWLIYFRSMLFRRLSGEKKEEKPFYSLDKIIKILKNIQETEFLISSFNINLKMAFENLLMEL